MPSIDIQVLEGVFSTEDKRLMIEKLLKRSGKLLVKPSGPEQRFASTKFKVVRGATAVSH